MSITDDSTGLDLTYTEKPVVAFTAGTLAGVAECVSEVESKLQRGTLGASTTPTLTQIQNWLVRAKQELAEVKGFTWKRRYASASTTADTYRYALPPDYNGGYTTIKDTTNDKTIKIWQQHWFDAKYPDPSALTSSDSFLATIKNMELWLAPPPNGAYALEIEYERSGDDNTPTDFSWLPELSRWLCCDRAIAEAFESLHDWNRANLFMKKWSFGLGKAIRADGKRRWASMGYQAISMFQEHTLRNS